jgi:hypothetical protein
MHSVGSIPVKSIAGSPDKKNEGDDQKKDNQHPILGFKAEKAKWLNEKLHRFRRFLGQGRWF